MTKSDCVAFLEFVRVGRNNEVGIALCDSDLPAMNSCSNVCLSSKRLSIPDLHRFVITPALTKKMLVKKK